jgi:hypothetical protein
MKKGLLFLSATLLIASLTWAQDSTSQMSTSSSNSPASGGKVQGCLSGSDGNYMLTQDGTGTMFKLVGGSDMLKKHVGHEVAITGQTASPSASPSDSSQGQGSAPTSDADANSAASSNTIQVSDVKMISKSCSSGSGSSH